MGVTRIGTAAHFQTKSDIHEWGFALFKSFVSHI